MVGVETLVPVVDCSGCNRKDSCAWPIFFLGVSLLLGAPEVPSHRASMSAEEITTQAEKTETPVTEEPIPSGFTKGLDAIEYNEYPDFDKNLISEAFIQKMVGQFNNENPEASFEAGGDDRWHIFGKSKPEPKDKIKFMMAKRQKEGFPTIEIMGYAEFEGVTAAVRALRAFVLLLGTAFFLSLVFLHCEQYVFSMPDLLPGAALQACWETMENHEIRKEWDGNMAEFHTIEVCGNPVVGKSGSWHEVCYSKTKYPFPLSARDCVYSKYISLDFEKGIFFCVWRCVLHPFDLVKQSVHPTATSCPPLHAS